MGVVDRHEPGLFSWTDLGTPDLDGAKQFYTSLFGWEYQDQPMDESGPYTMFTSGGHVVAAAYSQRPEQREQGIPPTWTTYVTVESADETAAKVQAAGGILAMEPFDVFDSGRMCFLGDPTGGFLAAWEPRQHIGAQLLGDPVSISWNELMTTDVAKAAEFYGKVFGWTTETQDMPNGPYTLFKLGERYVGGAIERVVNGGSPFWSVYFEVADCDDTAARTKDLGGEVHMPPTTVPTVGTFSLLADPQKVPFYVITSEPQPQG